MQIRQDIGVFLPTSFVIAIGTLLTSVVAICAFTWLAFGPYQH